MTDELPIWWRQTNKAVVRDSEHHVRKLCVYSFSIVRRKEGAVPFLAGLARLETLYVSLRGCLAFRKISACTPMVKLAFDLLEHNALCADLINSTFSLIPLESVPGIRASEEACNTKCLARPRCRFLGWKTHRSQAVSGSRLVDSFNRGYNIHAAPRQGRLVRISTGWRPHPSKAISRGIMFCGPLAAGAHPTSGTIKTKFECSGQRQRRSEL